LIFDSSLRVMMVALIFIDSNKPQINAD